MATTLEADHCGSVCT